jgi:hypothetical protein
MIFEYSIYTWFKFNQLWIQIIKIYSETEEIPAYCMKVCGESGGIAPLFLNCTLGRVSCELRTLAAFPWGGVLKVTIQWIIFLNDRFVRTELCRIRLRYYYKMNPAVFIKVLHWCFHVGMGFGHATSRARSSWSKKVYIFQTGTYKQPFTLMTMRKKIDLKWCKGDCLTLNPIEFNHSVHKPLFKQRCNVYSQPSCHSGCPTSILGHFAWDLW